MNIVMVIVFHSGIDDLELTIDSIPPKFCELVVVDVSPTGEAAGLCNDYDFVSWLSAPRNGGYAWGMNQGVAYALKEFGDSIDVVILSNPDVQYSEFSLRELSKVAASSEGICYPLQVAKSGDLMSHSVLPALGRAELLSGWLVPFGSSSSVKQARRTAESAYASSGVVEMPSNTSGSGACIALSYGAWKTIGGMDERFFLFSEDRMLTATAHRQGIVVSVCGNARVVHEGGFKSRGVSMLQLSEYIASQRFAWSALWPASVALLKVAQVGGLLLRAGRALPLGDGGKVRMYLRLARLAGSNKLGIAALTGEDGVRIRVLDRYPEMAR